MLYNLLNQILCNGTTTNAITFTGSVTGTTFSWTNNNTSIGLAAGGNGNIPAFTAINTANTQVVATITVTPTAAGCPGTPRIIYDYSKSNTKCCSTSKPNIMQWRKYNMQ